MNKISYPAERPVMRRFTLGLITVLLSLGVSLTAAEMILKYQRQQIENSDRLAPGMILFDPRLGWRLAPDWYGEHRHHDFEVSYRTNNYGFRGDFSRPAGGKRYAVIGDSFTFAQGVNDDQTFVHLLNETGGGRHAFLNFGVPGYSTDQEALLIRDRVRLFEPDVVVLVVYLGNDLVDNELAFPLQGEHAKPYFRVADGQLQLENSPVRRQEKPAAARGLTLSSLVIGEKVSGQSTFLNRLGQLELIRRMGLFQLKLQISDDVFSARFDSTLALFTALIGEIKKSVEGYGAQFKLVLLPGRTYVEQPASLSAQYQDYLRRRIVEDPAIASLAQVIDLASELRDAHNSSGSALYYPNEGHLTASGNRRVAEWLANWFGIALVD